MKVLKLIGVLLDYPQDELWEHREELLTATGDPTLPASRRTKLVAFARELLDADPLVMQDRWLATFDRGRFLSLLLFEHIHGESRDRGQAMVDLITAYRKQGFELAANELPDYLPLMLEYLARQPDEEAREWLRHIHSIVGLLAARAAERGSPYQPLFEMLVELADVDLDYSALRRRAGAEPRDDTPQAIDRVWEEEAVRFTAEAPAQGCPRVQS